MTERSSSQDSFIQERNKGMLAIAVSFPVAIALWLGIRYLAPPLVGLDGPADRMLFTLKCCCVAVLFCLVTGVEAVAHERLSSPAFDPLVGFETKRLLVNQRYLQNTLEQSVVFMIGLFGLAAYCADGAAMRAVLASAIVWVLARGAFWIGYHQSAAMRGIGAFGVAQSMIVLLYVVSRFGYESFGVPGSVLPVVFFLVIEAYLFFATRPYRRDGNPG